MSNIPDNLFYTSDHEWVRDEGETCVIGITDHAQDSLGDVTFVELPQVGDQFEIKTVFGVVESVKAASDLYMPVAGEVVNVNEELNDSPENVNNNPYEGGWMIRIRPSQSLGSASLLSAEDYRLETSG
jgi:glycine cleavage system H protein